MSQNVIFQSSLEWFLLKYDFEIIAVIIFSILAMISNILTALQNYLEEIWKNKVNQQFSPKFWIWKIWEHCALWGPSYWWRYKNFPHEFLQKFRQINFFTKELYCKSIWRKNFAVGENFWNYHTVDNGKPTIYCHSLNISWNHFAL